jgi:hypothetical protein
LTAQFIEKTKLKYQRKRRNRFTFCIVVFNNFSNHTFWGCCRKNTQKKEKTDVKATTKARKRTQEKGGNKKGTWRKSA